MRVTSAYSRSTDTPSSSDSLSVSRSAAFSFNGPAGWAGIRSPATAIATICWASTSSALRGMTVDSIRPSCMRRATTAHSSRSPRNLGKIRPRLTSPTPWPARPIRCMPRATDLGRLDLDDEVDRAHVDPQLGERAGGDETGELARLEQLLDLRALLQRQRPMMCTRNIRLSELVQAQRDPLGRAAVVDEHDRRVVLAYQPAATRGRSRARSIRAWTPLRREGLQRITLRTAGPMRVGGHRVRPSTRPALRSAGRGLLFGARVDDRDLRAGGRRGSGQSPRADSGSRSAARSSGPCARSRRRAPEAPGARAVEARCEPRLEWATAWISSTITASTPVSIARAREVRIR